MEAVAEHINEMQKIFEEYGTVFDELCKVFRETYPHKQVCEGGMGVVSRRGDCLKGGNCLREGWSHSQFIPVCCLKL